MVGTIGNLFRFIIVGSCSVAVRYVHSIRVDCVCAFFSISNRHRVIDFDFDWINHAVCWHVGIDFIVPSMSLRYIIVSSIVIL